MEKTMAFRIGTAIAAASLSTLPPRAVRAQQPQTEPAAPAVQSQQAPPPVGSPGGAPQGYPAPAYPPADYGYGPHRGYGYGPPQREHHFLLGDSDYRSPGLAVALSLQPLPVDFGNLYAENLGWGVAYTAIEVSLMAPMMWLGGSHMHHGLNDDRTWSSGEKGAMIGLVSGYVAVKLVSGLHAGYAAKAFNRAYEPAPLAFVAPTPGGALLGWGRAF